VTFVLRYSFRVNFSSYMIDYDEKNMFLIRFLISEIKRDEVEQVHTIQSHT